MNIQWILVEYSIIKKKNILKNKKPYNSLFNQTNEYSTNIEWILIENSQK